MADARLRGWTVLIVEDEPLIAIDVAITFEDAGATVCGPVRDVGGALEAIDAQALDALDGAVLDVNLGDHTCEAVALRLAARGVPYILHTGNHQGNAALIERLHAPVVCKPARGETLIAALVRRSADG